MIKEKKPKMAQQFRCLTLLSLSPDQFPYADKETGQRINVKLFEMKEECMLLSWKTIKRE